MKINQSDNGNYQASRKEVSKQSQPEPTNNIHSSGMFFNDLIKLFYKLQRYTTCLKVIKKL